MVIKVNKMKVLLTFFCFCVYAFCSAAISSANYNQSKDIAKAYKLVTQLRLKEATELLLEIKNSDPDNMLQVYVEDGVDFLVLMISEDPATYKLLERNQEIRIRKLKNGDPNSPYFKYLQAEVYLHWGAIQLKFGNYLGCLTNAYRAYTNLEENQKRFPSFKANLKGLGILHAIIGSVPDQYRTGLKWLVGMDGDLDQGLHEIQQLLEYYKTNDFIFEDEVKVIYTFLLMHLNNEGEKAWTFISSETTNYAQEPLMAVVKANVAYHTGKNDETISILNKMGRGGPFYPFWYAELMLGHAELNKLDPNANVPIEKFLKYYKGRNYIKEAYLLLSWHYLLSGDLKLAQLNLNNTIIKGFSTGDSDKSALMEATRGLPKEKILLKARLFFDGGYLQRALKTILELDVSQLSIQELTLEYYYRCGRIYQKMNNISEAIKNFNKVLILGNSSQYHFACNAALQMGIIYEVEKKYSLARDNFKLCLSLNPKDYADSLHARAKAGLQRIKKN